LRNYRESVSVGLRLVELDPSNAGWQRDLAVSQLCVGLTLETLGELTQAARSLRAAMETHRRAVELAAHFEREHAHWEAQYRRLALLKGDTQPESAADHLTLGYAYYGRKAFVKSAERFAAALEDERLRADLNRSNLYNAACAATLASDGLAGEEASRWRKRALAWLGEDIRRRRDALALAEKELGEGAPPDRAARVRRIREAVESHFEHARVKDPDLASLRRTPEFEALFEESNDER
jgi:tetratricopeptide (TPR) repeat protein